MDDLSRAAEAVGPVMQGPHRRPGDDVLPLRLVLQGSELSITLTRPEMVFGRHTDNDVRLPLPDVSRRHCRFSFVDNRWLVVDLNSLNGIFVNGEKVGQATLYHNDVLRIGSFTFDVELGVGSRRVRPSTADRPVQVLQSITDALPRADEGEETPPRRQAS